MTVEDERVTFDDLNKVFARLGKAIAEVSESIIDMFDKLEPYQRYELLHPRKKPRGSIRRARKRGEH